MTNSSWQSVFKLLASILRYVLFPQMFILEWCFGAAVYCVTTLTNKIPHCMFCDKWRTCPTKLFYCVLLIGESDALVSIVPNAYCMILFLESRTLLE